MIIKSEQKRIMDSLATPNYLFNFCCDHWRLKPNLDVCASEENKRCNFYFNEKVNALDVLNEWLTLDETFNLSCNTVVWCNPPHSKTKEFVTKAYHQWFKHNIDIIMLIPINCLCSNYARDFLLPYAEFDKSCIITGRHKFLDPVTNQPSKFNSVNGYVTVCYKKRNT